MPRAPDLTPAEFNVMKALWQLGHGSVADVRAHLAGRGIEVAYTTVMTLLGRLAQKDAVVVDRAREPFVYRAAHRRESVLRDRLRDFVRDVFDGDADALVLRLVEDETLSIDELRELERRIGASEASAPPPAAKRARATPEDEVSALLAAGAGARGVLAVLALVVLHGTVLAVLTWGLLRLAGRRVGPALAAALWAVVLLKFALPFGPAMPWSLSDAMSALLGWAHHAPGAPVATPPSSLVAPVAHVATAASLAWALLALAAVATWLIIAVVRVAAVVRAQGRAGRAARALPAASPAAIAEVAAIAQQLRLRRAPAVRAAPTGTSPAVVGLLAPILVLPVDLLGDAAPRPRAAAIGHELAHLRRRDPWIAAAAAGIAALFWFWPVVRLAARRLDAAREAACDAWALAEVAISPAEYARLLVRFARPHAGGAAVAHLAAVPGTLALRVDGLLAGRARARLGAQGVAVLAVWSVLALAGSRTAAARDGVAPRVCSFSPAIAVSIMAAHPEADTDGDGALSRDEVCGFEAEVRRRIVDDTLPAEPYATVYDLDGDGVLDSQEDELMRHALAQALPASALAAATPLLGQPLCCNCQVDEGTSSSAANLNPLPLTAPLAPSCVEGTEP